MNIPNAVPMSYNRGIHDVSGRTLAPQPLDQPSHLPKSFIFAQKGKPGKNYLVVGDSRAATFGAATFDELGPYFNHATAFNNVFNKAGNASMIERVVPDDIAPPAAFRLSIDLLETQVQDFERNLDGSYKINVDGTKIPLAGKEAGSLGKWVVEPISVLDGIREFGIGQITKGDQTDVNSSTQSDRYPIMDFMVSSEGAWGNDKGIALWVLTQLTNSQVDTRLITDQKAYPFQLAVKSRPDSLTTPSTVTTLGGAPAITFSLKPGLRDRNTSQQLYLGDIFVKSYQDISTPGFSPTIGDFDRVKVYDNNVATVLTKIYATELPHADIFSDLTGEADEIYRLNPFTAVSSYGTPYHTFQLVTGAANSVRLNEGGVMYAQGGTDGTMSDEVFSALVKVKLQEYGDKNSQRQNAVNHPENMFWDSGFPLTVKKVLGNFISIRKDTFVMASTHVVGGTELTDDQERSVAISLASALQNYPESEYYATPTVRACIIAGSGYLLNSNYTKSVPVAIDRAQAWSLYMGASNGKWVPNYKPDVNPNNVVSLLRDMNVVFRPANARYKDWDVGMVWPEPYTMDQMYFPQHQTVYPDDTSVLNGAITAFACAQLVRVGDKVHRDLTGRQDLSKDQIVERVNSAILAAVDGKFDNRFEIIPVTEFTADDNLRGYSWTTKIKLGAASMATVQSLTIESYRASDLQTQAV
jgi:hypothetical protein